MLSAVLARIGIPVLIRVLSGAIKDVEHPAASEASEALDYMDRALRGGQISAKQINRANRHLETMAKLEAAHAETAMREINTSLRAEIESEDKYVRRMRPTFGYLMALTWMAQMLGLAYVIIFKTEKAHIVLEAMASLGAIWTVALSVLGIYVYKRSEDKRAGWSSPHAAGIESWLYRLFNKRKGEYAPSENRPGGSKTSEKPSSGSSSFNE